MFDHFLVIDFEATCQEGPVIYPQEIIEFPSVLVDGATGSILSAFRTYVRPIHHPQLTDFCRDLTGITQADVDSGVSLAEALKMHDTWLDAHGAKLGNLAVVTWGDWDCRTMLEEFALGKAHFNLQDALRMAGLQWEGRLHCGLDDALNTARLLAELMRRGTSLAITGSLAPMPKWLPPQTQTSVSTVPYCYCGVASKAGVATMPGPMQGRSFYSCGYWTPGSLAPTQECLPPQPQTTMAMVPYCYCGVASKAGVATMPGPMQGRSFYSCGYWMPVCSWAT